VFSADDNSILVDINAESRINDSVFTSVGRCLNDSRDCTRIAFICDNKTLNLFNLEGKQVG
jgi:hypothetical protein